MKGIPVAGNPVWSRRDADAKIEAVQNPLRFRKF